jgi:threonine dehydrogenase-like Zn-dependent dehydrogenase
VSPRSVRWDGSTIATVTGPAATGDGVRVRVTSAGICGSDLHALAAGPIPVTLGHEFGGLLDDGRAVAVQPFVVCGQCGPCRRGDEQLCGSLMQAFHGGTRDGGLADEVLVDERSLVHLPPGVDPAAAALVEPIAVAVHAVNRAPLAAGERALVIGGGSIGLLCAAVLADRGVAVDVLARHPAQLAAAEAIGAGLAATGRYPLVVDAAGTGSSAAGSLRSVERGGRIVLVALPWEPMPYGAGLVFKEVTVVPAIYYGRVDGEREFDQAAAFLGRHPELPRILVTHRFGLDEAAGAFAAAADRAAGAIKVHLFP